MASVVSQLNLSPLSSCDDHSSYGMDASKVLKLSAERQGLVSGVVPPGVA